MNYFTNLIKKIFCIFNKNPYLNLGAWDYQKNFIEPYLPKKGVILDIGSGNFPSPQANLLADFFPDNNFHRSGKLSEKKPLIICSVERMPFLDKSLDFIICSHVLEHVENPLKAAFELCRTGKSGYIETPAYGKDILVGSGYMHKWQIVEFEKTLHFFEYSQRQKEAHIKSPIMDIWLDTCRHPWQDFFWERQDLFNAMLIWHNEINIKIYERKNHQNKNILSKPWKEVDENLLPKDSPTLTPQEIDLLNSVMATPDGKSSMHYSPSSSCFINSYNNLRYPVRGKRIYCEIGLAPNKKCA